METNKRLLSIMRYLYEYGFVTDNILNTVFFKKDENRITRIKEEENTENQNSGEAERNTGMMQLENNEESKGDNKEFDRYQAKKSENPEYLKFRREQLYWDKRLYNMNEALRELIKDGYMDRYQIGKDNMLGVRYTYFLTKKGPPVRERLFDGNGASFSEFLGGANNREYSHQFTG